MGMEGRGPCEVRRRICARSIVPRLSSGAPKTLSLPMCSTQNNTAQFPQSVWDKGDVLQSPPYWCCCLPDVLITSAKLDNTFIANRHVFHDKTVRLYTAEVFSADILMLQWTKLLPKCIIQTRYSNDRNDNALYVFAVMLVIFQALC